MLPPSCSLTPPPLSWAGGGKQNRDEKAHGSRKRQGDHFSVTVVAKTDSTWGKITLLLINIYVCVWLLHLVLGHKKTNIKLTLFLPSFPCSTSVLHSYGPLPTLCGIFGALLHRLSLRRHHLGWGAEPCPAVGRLEQAWNRLCPARGSSQRPPCRPPCLCQHLGMDTQYKQ